MHVDTKGLALLRLADLLYVHKHYLKVLQLPLDYLDQFSHQI